MRWILPLIFIPFIIYATSIHVWYALYDHEIELQIEFTNKYSSLKLEGILYVYVYVNGKIYHKGRFVVTKDNYSDDNILYLLLPKPPVTNFKVVIKFSNGKKRIQKTIHIAYDN